MTKRKKSFRLEFDEVAIVGTRDQWDHMLSTYNMLAEYALPKDKEYWLEAAAWLSDALMQDEYSELDQ